MLELKSAKELHGTIALPPNPDLLPLVASVALALRCPCTVEALPDTPLTALWCRSLASHVRIDRQGETVLLQPLDPAGAPLHLPYDRLHYRDFVVFCLLSAGYTMRFEALPPQRSAWWSQLSARLRCRLEVLSADGICDLRLVPEVDADVPGSGITLDEFHPFVAFALATRRRAVFDVDYQVATPLRHLLPAFGCELAVRAQAERPNDPIARRILRMKGKNVTSGTPGFTVTADFSAVTPTQARITLPGDDVLGSLYMAAKSIVQRGNLVMENVPLESWNTAMLQYVRRAGCAPALQETGTTSFGKVGNVQLQRFEPGGRKVECMPAWQYARHLPAMVALAIFTTEGKSVLRRMDDLRRDEPDGVAQLITVLGLIGAHHGEMPDGLVLRGASQYDGFDLTQAMPAHVAGACAMVGLKCMGRTTIEDTLLGERWPDFGSQLASRCEFRT
jgi:hypothetical protein